MIVKLAASAGFCSGVKTAIERVYNAASSGRIYTYGELIHNRAVTEALEKSNVRAINDLNELPHDANVTVAIRSHGAAPEAYRDLIERNIRIIDCTCSFVARTQRIAKNASGKGYVVIIAGDKNHPEVNGINGWTGGRSLIVKNADELDRLDFDITRKYFLIAQSTLAPETFESIAAKLKAKGVDFESQETICGATRSRRKESMRIASQSDAMIVLGDSSSSNARKLADLCREHSANVFFVPAVTRETLEALRLLPPDSRIGITAGASTPPEIIKEAVKLMSELENANKTLVKENIAAPNPATDVSREGAQDSEFEQMLNDTLVTLHTGDFIKGTVISVSPAGEVSVNIGYKSDGLIQRSEFSDDPNKNPADHVKPGDEIDVFVIRVNDGEGNVLLSKRRVDSQKSLDEFETAVGTKAVFKGRIIDVVKGGLIAIINDVRAFVPSSQISGRYVEDVASFKGKELEFNILEVDKPKRRVIAGRRELARKQAAESKERIFNSIDIGTVLPGKVSRIVDFGAFVDLGGVDGLIHISELSWGRVKNVNDVLKEGDDVTVTVINIVKEKEKISLSLRTEENNPWNSVTERFPVGSIITGKVVRLVPFGAFVEFEDGVDGLIHISQISDHHVEKPEDELKVGQVISVQVTDINVEKKKISLSKKLADRAMARESLEGSNDVILDESEAPDSGK